MSELVKPREHSGTQTVDDLPSEEFEAMRLLAEAIVRVPLNNKNPIAVLEIELNSLARTANEEISKAFSKRDHLDQRVRSLKASTGDRPDFLGDAVRGQILQLEDSVRQAQRQLHIIELAYALLKEYTWEEKMFISQGRALPPPPDKGGFPMRWLT